MSNAAPDPFQLLKKSNAAAAPNPFQMYERFFDSSVSMNSLAFGVDFAQFSFNTAAAFTATTAATLSALAIAPPIGVAIACLGTIACRVYTVIQANKEFVEILNDISFILNELSSVNPCQKSEKQSRSCDYVARHILSIAIILELFLKSESNSKFLTFTPVSYTGQLLREFTLLNAGLTIMLLEAKLQQPVETEAEFVSGGGPLNLDNPEFKKQVGQLLDRINTDVDDIITDSSSGSGKGGTKNKRNKNNRTRRRNNKKTNRRRK